PQDRPPRDPSILRPRRPPLRRPPTPGPRHVRLELEALEARWVPSAVRTNEGFFSHTVFGEASRQATIGFPVNYGGTTYTDLVVNANGSLTFGAPAPAVRGVPLSAYGVGMIAPPLGARAPPAPGARGRLFRHDTLHGRPPVPPPSAGFEDSAPGRARVNLFQAVLIARADLGPGDFDVELNYDLVDWDRSARTGGLEFPARAGFTFAASPSQGTYELPGSGVAGALLNGNQATGLVHHHRHSDADGRYVFEFRDGRPLLSQAPAVTIDPLPRPFVDAGATFVATGSFSDPRANGWAAWVDYGDGTGLQPLALKADHTFELSHVYASQASYTVTVTVTNGRGARGRASQYVDVLAPGASGLVR